MMFRGLELERKARFILGVTFGADHREVKRAYFRLAMKYHPDKNSGDKSSEEKFKAISEAYEILTSMKNLRSYVLLNCDIDFVHSHRVRSYEDWWKEAYGGFVW